jgi:hypothetical protein
MAVRLLLDEDSIAWALTKAINALSVTYECQVDIVRIGDQAVPTFGPSDDDVLNWAIAVGRTPVTHDSGTMISAYERMRNSGLATTGLIVWRSGFTYPIIAESLILIACCMNPEEIPQYPWFIPLGPRATTQSLR